MAYLDNLDFLVANPEELAFVVGELPFAVKAFRNTVETLLEQTRSSGLLHTASGGAKVAAAP